MGSISIRTALSFGELGVAERSQRRERFQRSDVTRDNEYIVRIRDGGAGDVATVLAMGDEAVLWMNARGNTAYGSRSSRSCGTHTISCVA
jgi:hypothetical protein